MKKVFFVAAMTLLLSGCVADPPLTKPSKSDHLSLIQFEDRSIVITEIHNKVVNEAKIRGILSQYRDLSLLVEDGQENNRIEVLGKVYSNYGFVFSEKLVWQTIHAVDGRPVNYLQAIVPSHVDHQSPAVDPRSFRYVPAPVYEVYSDYQCVLILDNQTRLIGIALNKLQ